VYRHVFHIRHKAVAGQKIPYEGIRRGHCALDDHPAGQTDKVQVVGMVGEMVGRCSVVQVGMRDHADLLERLKVAIDRGQRQGRTAVSRDRCGQPIGRGMTKDPDGIEDSLPLPGQTHAPGPQPLAKVGHTGEPTRRREGTHRLAQTPVCTQFHPI